MAPTDPVQGSAAVRCIHCRAEGTHRVCDECFDGRLSKIGSELRGIREGVEILIAEESWEDDAMRVTDA